MKIWVACQRDGNYTLCLLRPTWARIRGTEESDWYIQPGEPLGVRHLCRVGVESLGVVLQPSEIATVRLSVELV